MQQKYLNEAHELYEMKSTEDVFKGADAVKEAGRRFAESERTRLKEADAHDKEQAKEKKREKKRKRREREHEVSYLTRMGLMLTECGRTRDTMNIKLAQARVRR